MKWPPRQKWPASAKLPGWPGWSGWQKGASALPPRVRALLILVALLLGGLGLAVALALPLIALHQRYDERIEEGQDNLQRYRRLAREAPALQAGLSQAQALAPGQRFFSGDDPADRLREQVETLFTAGGGKLQGLQDLPTADEGRFRRLGVSLQGTLGSEALRRVLHDAESREPWLFIDRLSLRSPYGPQNPPPPGVDPEFAVEMSLSGYARVPP